MHVVPAPGTSVVVGQLTTGTGPAGDASTSAIPRSVIVTFPLLVTANEYVIV